MRKFVSNLIFIRNVFFVFFFKEKRHFKKRAFSLIELAVILLILALLLEVFILGYKKLIERSSAKRIYDSIYQKNTAYVMFQGAGYAGTIIYPAKISISAINSYYPDLALMSYNSPATQAAWTASASTALPTSTSWLYQPNGTFVTVPNVGTTGVALNKVTSSNSNIIQTSESCMADRMLALGKYIANVPNANYGGYGMAPAPTSCFYSWLPDLAQYGVRIDSNSVIFIAGPSMYITTASTGISTVTPIISDAGSSIISTTVSLNQLNHYFPILNLTIGTALGNAYAGTGSTLGASPSDMFFGLSSSRSGFYATNFIAIFGVNTAGSAINAAMSASVASIIDAKYDDGLPLSGLIIASPTSPYVNGIAGYNTTSTTINYCIATGNVAGGTGVFNAMGSAYGTNPPGILASAKYNGYTGVAATNGLNQYQGTDPDSLTYGCNLLVKSGTGSFS